VEQKMAANTLAKPKRAVHSSGARNAPHIDLETAINKIQELHHKAKRSAIHAKTAAQYLGYSPNASSAQLVLAALKKYGLLTDEGSNENRRVKVSDLAIRIIMDLRDPSPDREALIRKAAVLPKAHQELWQEYGCDLPDDKSLETFFMLEKSYARDAAVNAVRVYRATFTFAGLDQAGILGDVIADDSDGESGVADQAQAPSATMVGVTPKSDWKEQDAAGSTRTFSIPLGPQTFDIRVPRDLTKDDFRSIVETLNLWERQLVTSD
jgi:hypothetical protein